jgi:hypothetical protein
VVGLGFTAQGFDLSSYYRRLPASYDPRAAFIFEGVEDEIIGDFGLVGGGAAGLELDRADFALGTPPNLLVLASSENHTDLTLVVTEEVNVMTPDLSGSQNELVRADVAFFDTPAGGAVFSVGSIAWCGALSHRRTATTSRGSRATCCAASSTRRRSRADPDLCSLGRGTQKPAAGSARRSSGRVSSAVSRSADLVRGASLVGGAFRLSRRRADPG